jgi:hypothetical protein
MLMPLLQEWEALDNSSQQLSSSIFHWAQSQQDDA